MKILGVIHWSSFLHGEAGANCGSWINKTRYYLLGVFMIPECWCSSLNHPVEKHWLLHISALKLTRFTMQLNLNIASQLSNSYIFQQPLHTQWRPSWHLFHLASRKHYCQMSFQYPNFEILYRFSIIYYLLITWSYSQSSRLLFFIYPSAYCPLEWHCEEPRLLINCQH